MKLKNGIIVSPLGKGFVAVPSGDAGRNFNGMLKINGTAAFIIGLLREDTDEEALTKAVCKEYDVDETLARQSVDKTVGELKKTGLFIL